MRSLDRRRQPRDLHDPAGAREALDHFKACFARQKGRPMVEWPYHPKIMDDLVGAIGLPYAKAAAETWFTKGSWSGFADGEAHHSLEGFQRCVEQIQDSAAYRAAKKRHEFRAG